MKAFQKGAEQEALRGVVYGYVRSSPDSPKTLLCPTFMTDDNNVIGLAISVFGVFN